MPSTFLFWRSTSASPYSSFSHIICIDIDTKVLVVLNSSGVLAIFLDFYENCFFSMLPHVQQTQRAPFVHRIDRTHHNQWLQQLMWSQDIPEEPTVRSDEFQKLKRGHSPEAYSRRINNSIITSYSIHDENTRQTVQSCACLLQSNGEI